MIDLILKVPWMFSRIVILVSVSYQYHDLGFYGNEFITRAVAKIVEMLRPIWSHVQINYTKLDIKNSLISFALFTCFDRNSATFMTKCSLYCVKTFPIMIEYDSGS